MEQKVNKEDTLKFLEIMEDQLQSYSLKLEALTNRYNHLSKLEDNKFKPNSINVGYEEEAEYIRSIKDSTLANLRIDMNATVERIWGIESTISNIKTELINLDKVASEKSFDYNEEIEEYDDVEETIEEE